MVGRRAPEATSTEVPAAARFDGREIGAPGVRAAYWYNIENEDTMSASSPVFHSDPDILGGTPVFTGTRVPVRALLRLPGSRGFSERVPGGLPHRYSRPSRSGAAIGQANAGGACESCLMNACRGG